MVYSIVFSQEAADHLAELTARQRSALLDRVEAALAHEPLKETRNRKPLRENAVAPWELRIGELRVFYRVMEEPERTVCIVAIGVKIGNRVMIAGEEAEL